MNALRHILILAFWAVAVAVSSALPQRYAAAETDFLPADSVLVERLLAEAKTLPPSENKALFFARKFLGRPYVAHTLEKNDTERLIVNTRQLDCTTLVETVAALVLCDGRGQSSFHEYAAILKSLRYRQGVMDGYASRLHYFSDWIADKQAMGFVDDVQEPVPPFTAVKTLRIDYMSRHSGSYKALRLHPELLDDIARQEKELSGGSFRYIPKSQVLNNAAMRKAVKDGDIIAIVSGKRGLDIAHLGFAVWRYDGLHLLNASMIHRKVVEEPMTLYRYLRKHPSHLGIRIVRISVRK